MSYPTDFNDTVVYNGVDLYVPKDCSCTVMEDSRVFLFGEFYLNGQAIMTGSGVASGSEVNVGPTQPVDPGITLWFDTSTGYGELKAKVGGSWKTVEDPADDALQDEIYIGGVEPVGGNYELWVDTATDVPPPSESFISAGNALGIIAVGRLNPTGNPYVLTANTVTKITDDLSVSLSIGRRYRINVFIRSAITQVNYSSVGVILNRNGVGYPNANFPFKRVDHQTYEQISASWIIDGDGVTANYSVSLNSINQVLHLFSDTQSYFNIEDVGPNTSPALPIPETPPAWIPIIFEANFQNEGAGFACAYRKIGDTVSLRGLVRRVNSALSSSAIMFKLPAGFYNPVQTLYFTGLRQDAQMASIVIETDGDVIMYCIAPLVAMPAPSFVSLSQISFSVTP